MPRQRRDHELQLGDEVDRVAWLTPPAAAERLTYDRDREVLRSLTEDH